MTPPKSPMNISSLPVPISFLISCPTRESLWLTLPSALQQYQNPDRIQSIDHRNPPSFYLDDVERRVSLSISFSSHFPYWWQKLAIQIIMQMYEVRLRKRLNLIWKVALKDETLQTYQLWHTEEPREAFPDKTASRQELSYEGSSKKRKNTYLWTRCGSGCCTLEHIYELFLGVVSIWEMMWEMNFIRSGNVSRLHFAILKALTLTDL